MNTPLDGLNVLVTGNLASMSRPQAHQVITGLGGHPVASVTKTTGLVILGDGAGLSKMAKIRGWNLPVLTGDAFERLVEGLDRWTDPPGVPCRDWEAAAGSGVVDDPEPVDATPWAQRHLRSLASVPVRGADGRVRTEHRMLCMKCGMYLAGPDRSIREKPCPNSLKEVS